jgi:hypothetical protein
LNLNFLEKPISYAIEDKINVRKKPKGQSRMDNPETMACATLGIQDTGRKQQNTTLKTI